MQVEVVSVLWPYAMKAVVGLVITGLGALMLYPVRYARREWKSIKEAVASTHAELITQRTNCLQTLQNQGDSQIKLLAKMSDTLDGVRLDFAEHRSYVQGLVQSPMRARAKTKVKK
jgi:hypothetical protein